MKDMDLVLEGGGVKGIGLVGAIAALHRAGYACGSQARVAGTSAGAVVGSLVAAGATVDELSDIMREVDYRRFRDENALGKVGNVLSLVTRLGLYRGDWLHRWIEQHLADHGVRTFGDLRITDDADSALPAQRAYRLVVIVSDVSRGRMVRLPWDYREHYNLDPDEQPVADAVRASASIPFFFRPARLPDGRRGIPSCCVDGGMLSNFPVHVFDRRDDAPPRWPTFGIKLSARSSRMESSGAARPIHGLLDLAKAMIATMVEAHDRNDLDDPSVLERTIFVNTEGVHATDFDLAPEQRDRLYANGQVAAQNFLLDWNFDRYRARYARTKA